MSSEILALADNAEATRDDWLAAVETALRGGSFDRLVTTTLDGLEIAPLYTAEDAPPPGPLPGAPGSVRSGRPEGRVAGAWEIRQVHGLPGPEGAAATNAEILADLERGVSSVELSLRWIDDLATLDRVLDGVLLDLAPVGLVGGGDGVAGAELLVALADQRGLPPGALVADLGCDPLGHLATTGVPVALEPVGELAARVGPTRPGLRVMRADGRPYAEAGASPGQELAAVVATGVAYLRTLTAAGLEPADALARVLLVSTVDTDQFGGIAKIRALRRMWARVAEQIGAPAVPAAIQAVTLDAMFTRRDPWVNMLRGTLAAFAAGVGGADIVTVAPFDSAVGRPDQLGRRIARNTQLILQAESNLHRVIDPAGGSWAVEAHTEDLAQAAWARFRAIDAAGGMAAALESGRIHDEIDQTWQTRSAAIARRKQAIIGVSEYPDLGERPIERDPVAPEPRSGERPDVAPLPRRRWADVFESLRDAADAVATRPKVFAANLGPIATHTARLGFARNLFEAGGIAIDSNDGFATTDEVVAAFTAAGTSAAVLCSSDAVYSDRAAETAAALKDAGASWVVLAGHPGDQRAAYEAAGVDTFIHLGCDVVEVLHHAHELLVKGASRS